MKKPQKTRSLQTWDRGLLDYAALCARWRKNPVLYARERMGVNPTRQQQQMLMAIAPSGAKVTVRAGHGVGKTTCLAIIIWWHLECFSFCKIPCTAPTASQLRLVLWSELRKVLRRADDQAAKDGMPKLSDMFTFIQDKISVADTEWYAVARTARRDQPDALQGFHASDLDITADDRAVQRSASGGNILFVIEEDSGVADEIYTVAEGALSSKGARLIMVGNPVRSTGFFADSHLDPRRVSSYTPLHFSVKDSPLVEPDYRARLVRKYGEGSNVVRVRADGEFPKQDDDVLISVESTETALHRAAADADPHTRCVLGVDVARFGDDRTTYVVRQGRAIRYIEVRSKEDTMVTAGRALEIARRFGADVQIDVIGVGAGVYDRLNETQREHGLNVVAVNVSDAATMAHKTSDRRSNALPDDKFGKREMFPRSMKEYLWLSMKDWFDNEEPVLHDGESVEWMDHARDMAAECATVRYTFDSAGKLVVESKDSMKKRGLLSPDLAEALACTFAPNRLSIWERLG